MESITGFLEDFDFAKLLPEIAKFLSGMRFWLNFIMLLGPVLMLIFGLCYFFRPAQEPSEKIGFRVSRAMAGTEAWLYAQKLAGLVWMCLGGGMTILSLVLFFVFLALEPLALATGVVIWIGVQVILSIVSYFFLLTRINAQYDKEGKPKKKR